jgi:hypothetical protein
VVATMSSGVPECGAAVASHHQVVVGVTPSGVPVTAAATVGATPVAASAAAVPPASRLTAVRTEDSRSRPTTSPTAMYASQITAG